MKLFIPIIAATVLVAGAVQAAPILVDSRNAAEINFGSTHPGTLTARSGLSTQDQVVLRPKGEISGISKPNVQVTQERNYNVRSQDRMFRNSDIDHRIPSK